MSVADIIRAVDEPIDATQCGGNENCLDDRRCMTHELWTDLNRHIYEYLDAVKLADLVATQREQASNNTVSVVKDQRDMDKQRAPKAAVA